MGIASGGTEGVDVKCKKNDDRNVTFSETVDVCETDMTINICDKSDDTLPVDELDEPLVIAEKMDIEVQAIVTAQQVTDDTYDPADSIKGGDIPLEDCNGFELGSTLLCSQMP